MSEELFNSASCSGDCTSCGSDCQDLDQPTVTLTLDDDTEVECAILTIFPVDAQEYIALLPLDENGQNQNGEVYLYRFSRTEKGDPMLANIDDDAEYQAAATAFDIVLDNARKAEAAGAPLE